MVRLSTVVLVVALLSGCSSSSTTSSSSTSSSGVTSGTTSSTVTSAASSSTGSSSTSSSSTTSSGSSGTSTTSTSGSSGSSGLPFTPDSGQLGRPAGYCPQCQDGHVVYLSSCPSTESVDIGNGQLACTIPCNGAGDCTPGWACNGGYCTCVATAETCNGLDDDCNGIIDDPTPADASCSADGYSGACQNHACTCLGDTCPSGCVDEKSDANNCGGCGQTCSGATNAVGACADAGCTIACVSGFGDCDGDPSNGCEHALDADPISCGSCDHDCLGASCDGGLCAPTLVVDVASYAWSIGDDPFVLDHDAGLIYFVAPGGPNSFSSTAWTAGVIGTAIIDDGGVIATSAVDNPGRIAFDDQYIYFANYYEDYNINGSESYLGAIPRAGGQQAFLTAAYANDIAVDPSGFYWTGYGADAGLWRLTSDGGAQPLAQAQGQAVALDPSYIYWSTLGAWPTPPAIERVLKDGSASEEVVAADRPGAGPLAVDGREVFWLEDGALMTRELTGGAPQRLATFSGTPAAIAVTRYRVFWGVYPDGIFEMPRVGGPPLKLALPARGLSSLAVDGPYLYWSDSTGLWRVAW